MKNRYKVLDSLPPYGPMYIPIASDGRQFYSEGFVVRFYKSDTSEWVANFELGRTSLREVIEFNGTPNLLIIADGTCYMMDPESSQPLSVFGGDYSKVIITEDRKIVHRREIRKIVAIWMRDLHRAGAKNGLPNAGKNAI